LLRGEAPPIVEETNRHKLPAVIPLLPHFGPIESLTMRVDHRTTFALPHQATAAGMARQHVAAACPDLSRDDYEVALLLTSELVTNAIQHSNGEIELVVCTGTEGVHIEVRDQSDLAPRPRAGDSLAPQGRGLMLVERLATAWGFNDSPPSGKSVWCELRASAS
jgi:anti-sigma regulatory factor (Ser/Thr protein kinase)